MSEWKEIVFSDLFSEGTRNGVFKTNGKPVVDARLIGMGTLFHNDFIRRSPEETLGLTADEYARFSVRAGDLLFGRRSLVESGAGKVSLVVAVDSPTVFESSLIRVRLDPSKADPRFYAYYFKAGVGRGRIFALVNGAAVKGIRSSDLQKVVVHWPPLPTQKRIADILSVYDDLIENNRRRMEILEESARLIFKERFGEVKATGVLADICEEVRRAVKPSDVADDTPYIGLEHMPRRSISLCQWDGAGKVTSTKHGFNEGEILFGKIRPYFHKVGLAFVDGVASSDAIVIRPLKAELRNYVLLTVSSVDFVAAASQGMKEGSKMPRADWGLLLKYPVSIPTEKALADFNQLIEPIMQQLKALCFTNRKLAEARDVLLPKLMSGRK